MIVIIQKSTAQVEIKFALEGLIDCKHSEENSAFKDKGYFEDWHCL